MSAVLCLVVLAVLQLILTLHIRNTVADSASEGARYAALEGRTPADGAARTRELIGSAISPAYAEQVSAGTVTVDGAQLVEVTVQAKLPLVGLFGVQSFSVTGHGVRDLP